MNIRALNQEDITKIKSITPEGWGDITPYFQFYLTNPNCFTFVAEEKGKLIGSGNYINLTKSGWLSHVIVIPEYRNQGLGKVITELLISEHSKKNGLTLNLIATPMGEPVYKKLGFRTTSKYLFFRGQIQETISTQGMRPLTKDDMPAIFKLDQRISGEDRTNLITSDLEGWVVDSESGLRGYYLSNLWEGPVLAIDEEAGIALLNKKLQEREIVVLPEENSPSISFLKRNEFKEFHVPGMRMSLGNPVLWKPQMIYGRIAGAFG